VRPGGLKESEQGIEGEGIVFSGAGGQEGGSLPRRLVARVCLDALDAPASIGRIVEITSSPGRPQDSLATWLNQPQAAPA